MRGRWGQVKRALRVVLACVVLLLTAPAPAPAPADCSAAAGVWTHVVVAFASGERPSVTAAVEARAAREAPCGRSSASAAPAPPVEPRNRARTLVVIRDLYLRNQALLC